MASKELPGNTLEVDCTYVGEAERERGSRQVEYYGASEWLRTRNGHASQKEQLTASTVFETLVHCDR